MSVLALAVIQAGPLAMVVTTGLVAGGRQKAASLWQRTIGVVSAAALLNLGNGAMVVFFSDGWVLTTTAIAVAAVTGAVAIQIARAARVRPPLQLVVGTLMTTLGLLSAVHSIVM